MYSEQRREHPYFLTKMHLFAALHCPKGVPVAIVGFPNRAFLHSLQIKCVTRSPMPSWMLVWSKILTAKWPVVSCVVVMFAHADLAFLKVERMDCGVFFLGNRFLRT